MTSFMKKITLCCFYAVITISFSAIGQTLPPPPCTLSFWDLANPKIILRCKMVVKDMDGVVKYNKKSHNGKFSIGDIVSLGECDIEFEEEDDRYWPVNTSEMICPMVCGQRILVKKKQSFSSIKK